MTSKQSNEQAGSTQSDTLLDGAFLEDIRRQMIRFATLQLGDGHQAEDAVQEALIGAMKNAKSFGGRAALKTWIFAILKNKIADTLRQKQRTVNIGSLQQDDDDSDMSELFDRKGFWQVDERPVGWGSPEATLREGQFWVVFEACLEHLPPKQARVFMMREFIELDADEICMTVELTTTNLHVLLHRARLRLRECVENNWYLEGEKNVELS
jgi:RNA polymerase sigma-70 factor (ECF subfamily)